MTDQQPGSVTINAPADLHPDGKGVALFFLTTKAGISVELQVDGGGDTIDPNDPAHAIAFYVQHNTLQLLPQAAMWFMQMAKEQKAAREQAANEQMAIVLPRGEVAVAEQPIVGVDGQSL